eukprot:CAMPEP_0204826526 /NCGR_PEP_ID=MMETSP1346-20131115/4197_1 /ASSEMBLY_ACC=CAM_ASM_000771 /TAXON_ID=215587 /ORGANISM="Aplanochytrium stocchinoi, Strain GSBS06" /LENGTH=457 /DNA_ID=CAMNT_0051954591 /DNA_START=245 /DNA_END=1618 /DNA_ORIENTATION=+
MMNLTEADIQPQLTRRRPGQSRITTPRSEADIVTIQSGTERGMTLGTPIALTVDNENVRPGDYKEMSMVPRPGHADFTYQVKYGIRAASGGGRSSARETIGRVAAGAVADKWLAEKFGTKVVSFVTSVGNEIIDPEGMQHPSGRPWTREEVDQVGTLRVLRNPATGWKILTEADVAEEKERAAKQKELDDNDEDTFVKGTEAKESALPAYIDSEKRIYNRFGVVLEGNKKPSEKELKLLLSEELVPVRCPHPPSACRITTLIRSVKSTSDSIGGTVCCVCTKVPPALGEPCFDKLEALLAHGIMSLPATKGFEIGSGFEGTKLRGSQHNDVFEAVTTDSAVKLKPKTNHAGGTLGGISSGSDIIFRVAVKPVSTIGKAQDTVDFLGQKTVLAAKGRHDPCVLPRTPPLIEAMTSLVLIDAALIQLTRTGNGTTMSDQNQVGLNSDPTSQANKRHRAE